VRRFHLVRSVDETGISGTGVVAEGVQYSDGVIALRWCSRWPASVCFYQGGVAAVEAVHGHNGLTTIEWLDPLEDIVPPEESLQTVTPPA
jgi:hypothetical protein